LDYFFMLAPLATDRRKEPPTLGDDGRRRLQRAEIEAAALRALSQLAELYSVGPWHAAGRIAERLATFERSPTWRRIRLGSAEPSTRLETLLAAVAASDLPRSRRRLFDLLS
jgi:hypothetical protein